MKAALQLSVISNPPILETERLILKPAVEELWEDIFITLSDPEIREKIKMPCHDTIEKQKAWWATFQKWKEEGEAMQWCGYLKDSGQYIGLFTVKCIELSNFRGELGYSIVRSLWKQGFATEGVKCVQDYCFDTVGFHTLFAQILPDNYGSLRIVEKLGFEPEGHFRDVHLYHGQFYDILQFARLNPAHL